MLFLALAGVLPQEVVERQTWALPGKVPQELVEAQVQRLLARHLQLFLREVVPLQRVQSIALLGQAVQ